MKYLLILPLFLLSACSSLQGDFFDTSSRYKRIQKKEFVGRSAGEVVELLGKPRTILAEDPNQVWTYRKDKCITFIYFNQNNKVGFAEERGECLKLPVLQSDKGEKNEAENNA